MENNKAQHEIVGFVLIVLIVSVIGVVFLTIMFNSNDVRGHSSVEISNLLEASMYYTTSCAIDYIPNYREMQDLIKDCYKGSSKKCYDKRDSCKVVEGDLKNILDASLNVGETHPNKAYKFDIYYSSEDEETSNEEVLSLSSGEFMNCSSIVGGNHPIPIGDFGFGNIYLELDVCKGSI
ncbi:MAG: hypothetical protein ABIH37_03630 [archaeon]